MHSLPAGRSGYDVNCSSHERKTGRNPVTVLKFPNRFGVGGLKGKTWFAILLCLLRLLQPQQSFGQGRAVDYYRQAESAYDRADWDSALADYARTIELAPNYAEAYH